MIQSILWHLPLSHSMMISSCSLYQDFLLWVKITLSLTRSLEFIHSLINEHLAHCYDEHLCYKYYLSPCFQIFGVYMSLMILLLSCRCTELCEAQFLAHRVNCCTLPLSPTLRTLTSDVTISGDGVLKEVVRLERGPKGVALVQGPWKKRKKCEFKDMGPSVPNKDIYKPGRELSPSANPPGPHSWAFHPPGKVRKWTCAVETTQLLIVCFVSLRRWMQFIIYYPLRSKYNPTLELMINYLQ